MLPPACELCGGKGFRKFRDPAGRLAGSSICKDCSGDAAAFGVKAPLGDLGLQRLRESSFDTFDCSKGPALVAALAAARQYAANPEGFLVLNGPAGAGKSHLAKAVLAAAAHPGTWAGVVRLLDRMRSPEFREVFDYSRIMDARLLALDGLGEERQTEWADEQLANLVNHRYEHKLATVVTTRMLPDDPALPAKLTDRRFVRWAAVVDG